MLRSLDTAALAIIATAGYHASASVQMRIKGRQRPVWGDCNADVAHHRSRGTGFRCSGLQNGACELHRRDHRNDAGWHDRRTVRHDDRSKGRGGYAIKRRFRSSHQHGDCPCHMAGDQQAALIRGAVGASGLFRMSHDRAQQPPDTCRNHHGHRAPEGDAQNRLHHRSTASAGTNGAKQREKNQGRHRYGNQYILH